MLKDAVIRLSDEIGKLKSFCNTLDKEDDPPFEVDMILNHITSIVADIQTVLVNKKSINNGYKPTGTLIGNYNKKSFLR